MGILKPSITFSLFGLLQLAPVRSSSLPSLLQLTPQFAPVCSPVHSSSLPPCPLAPYTPQVVGTPTHTLAIGSKLEWAGSEMERAGRLERAGASWSKGSKLERAGRLERAGSKLEQAGKLGASWEAGESWEQEGASWKQGEWAGGFLRPKESSRDPGMLREQGEQAGSKGSELAPQVYGSMHIWLHAYTAPCIYGSMHIWLHAYMAPCVYGPMRIWLHAYIAPYIYDAARIQCSLPSLLARFPHSSLLPACSPISSLLPAHPLAPCSPEVVGIPIHTKLFIGHWEPAGSKLEGAGASWEWGKFQGPRDTQGARGVSWELPDALGRCQGLEMHRGQGEQAGSKGSKLGARGVSWKWGAWAGDFLRPQENSRDPGMLREQGEWAGDFLRPQGGPRDPGMLRE